MREPGRLITAMATPFLGDGSLNRDGAARLARHLVDTGTETVLVNGTTGESPVLTHAEKFDLLDIVRGAVGRDAAVMMGTGTNSTSDSISLTREAEDHGADLILLVAPYYNKPPQEGLFSHFAAIANATRLPVMLYNVPGRTSSDILPETVIRLSEISNIFAVKEASGQVTRTAEILNGALPGFRVYSGDDALTLPILSLGGHGIVSVLSNLDGRPLRRLIDAYVRGAVTEAAAAHRELLPLFKALFITTSPIPLKAALKIMGLPGGSCRPPLVDATPAEVIVIRKAMQAARLLQDGDK